MVPAKMLVNTELNSLEERISEGVDRGSRLHGTTEGWMHRHRPHNEGHDVVTRFLRARVELYQAAQQIVAKNPKFVFLPGPEDTGPLRKQAGLCFASELLKIPFIMITTERIRWGMCEAMTGSDVVIRFEGVVTSFAEEKYASVPALLQYLEVGIPKVDMSSVDGPNWLKRFGEMFVQTGEFHTIISNWLAVVKPGQQAWETKVYDVAARPDKLL